MKIGTRTGRTARWLLAVVMAFGVSTAMAQITSTRHNLGTTGGNPGTTKLTAGTDEICVFCHTPHAADSFTGAPLWNKRIDTGKTYTLYGTSSTTMDAGLATGGVTATPAIGSVSLACLSCHDGAQAMDNILNAPGTGGYAGDGGAAGGLGWAWAGNATAAGNMNNSLTSLAMLDTDLSNDHPIGIRYCGGGPMVGALTGACVDADFKAPANNGTAWWVDTEAVGNAVRNKTDMILYTRTFATGANGPSVECASCHDPHTNANPTFLRISNAGSGVCLACHNK